MPESGLQSENAVRFLLQIVGTFCKCLKTWHSDCFFVIRENYRSERNLLTKGCFQRVHKNIQNVTQI